MYTEILQEVKSVFETYIREVQPLGIMVFGSQADNSQVPSSDLDICIILGKKIEPEDLRRVWRYARQTYDVWFFEELAVYMQHEVLKNHLMIYAEDEPALFEYLRPYQKLINDYKYRLKVAYGEI